MENKCNTQHTALRDAIITSKNKAPTIPSENVEITKIKFDQVKELANINNPIFSQVSPAEVGDIVKALTFADDPIPGINERLKEFLGEDTLEIKLPVLERYIEKTIMYRHPADRRRVDEFIRALRAMNSEQPLPDDRKSFWSKLRPV